MEHERQHDITFSSAWLEGSLTEDQIGSLTSQQLEK